MNAAMKPSLIADRAPTVLAGSTPSLVFDPKDPMPIARALIAKRYMRGRKRILQHHRDAFYVWNGTAYVEIDAAAMRAEIWTMLENAERVGPRGRRGPLKPSAGIVSNVVDALRGATYLDSKREPPCWLEEPGIDVDPTNLIACANGLLDVSSRALTPHTPAFFNLNVLEFDYDPQAPAPQHWLAFLHSILPNDPEAIETLQEIFGLCLTPDTSYQKMFMIEGPTRSGKGTIARVLGGLVGRANVCNPTLGALGTQFGAAPLIGKRLAIFADARLGARADQQAIAERLLSISGEDAQTIDRKHKDAWSGTLRTRLLMLTNELPKFTDASGALPSRFIILILRESFLGREDLGLTDRLLGELPGILCWSLDGLDRLRKRGHFRTPKSAAEAATELADLANPIRAFVRDRCEVASCRSVDCTALFDAWREWCHAQGRDRPGTAQTFGRYLRKAFPHITITQPRTKDGRDRQYDGIGLK